MKDKKVLNDLEFSNNDINIIQCYSSIYSFAGSLAPTILEMMEKGKSLEEIAIQTPLRIETIRTIKGYFDMIKNILSTNEIQGVDSINSKVSNLVFIKEMMPSFKKQPKDFQNRRSFKSIKHLKNYNTNKNIKY